jgi:excisionase family DNA binding protein
VTQSKDAEGREILTIEEAASFLGVSVKTFNKVLHTQSIPARKIGREWKFSRQALVDWIGGGRSTDFYRESTDHGNGNVPEQDDSERRTSGWRLELD